MVCSKSESGVPFIRDLIGFCISAPHDFKMWLFSLNYDRGFGRPESGAASI
jgi:hypothetical protein